MPAENKYMACESTCVCDVNT